MVTALACLINGSNNQLIAFFVCSRILAGRQNRRLFPRPQYSINLHRPPPPPLPAAGRRQSPSPRPLHSPAHFQRGHHVPRLRPLAASRVPQIRARERQDYNRDTGPPPGPAGPDQCVRVNGEGWR